MEKSEIVSLALFFPFVVGVVVVAATPYKYLKGVWFLFRCFCLLTTAITDTLNLKEDITWINNWGVQNYKSTCYMSHFVIRYEVERNWGRDAQNLIILLCKNII